ncbi:MAG: ABC transporter ATP-binding protein [Bacteroidetes bacterium]|nr:ABC transporter ATP-binding protein [Bacteroidota bacterium]
MLKVNNISFNYTNQNYFKGIRNVSLQLNKGEILALVGKSGSGKTTLMKCIYGLEDLKEGEVLCENKKVTGPAYNLMPGHPEMKLVSQDFYVLDNHSVEENIFDKLIGYTNEAKQKRANKLLKLLDLVALKNSKARFLSSGQKQRVAIARALAIMPKILLLDEPFSNLDTILSEKLFSFIMNEVKKNKTAVILITHLADEALKYADSLAVLDNGKILQIGKKWQIYYKPNNTRLAGLLGPFNIIKSEDLEKKTKQKKKLFVRPDKLKLTTQKNAPDIQLVVLNCTFNGKCFEILGETKNGNSVIVYLNKELEQDQVYYFLLDQ